MLRKPPTLVNEVHSKVLKNTDQCQQQTGCLSTACRQQPNKTNPSSKPFSLPEQAWHSHFHNHARASRFLPYSAHICTLGRLFACKRFLFFKLLLLVGSSVCQSKCHRRRLPSFHSQNVSSLQVVLITWARRSIRSLLDVAVC